MDVEPQIQGALRSGEIADDLVRRGDFGEALRRYELVLEALRKALARFESDPDFPPNTRVESYIRAFEGKKEALRVRMRGGGGGGGGGGEGGRGGDAAPLPTPPSHLPYVPGSEAGSDDPFPTPPSPSLPPPPSHIPYSSKPKRESIRDVGLRHRDRYIVKYKVAVEVEEKGVGGDRRYLEEAVEVCIEAVKELGGFEGEEAEGYVRWFREEAEKLLKTIERRKEEDVMGLMKEGDQRYREGMSAKVGGDAVSALNLLTSSLSCFSKAVLLARARSETRFNQCLRGLGTVISEARSIISDLRRSPAAKQRHVLHAIGEYTRAEIETGRILDPFGGIDVALNKRAR